MEWPLCWTFAPYCAKSRDLGFLAAWREFRDFFGHNGRPERGTKEFWLAR